MRVAGMVLAGTVLFAAAASAAPPPSPTPVADPHRGAERFREATLLVRSGDLPGGTRLYRELAAAGTSSASLYWNWAQAAGARGEVGEAIWALLRAREVDPGDAAVTRELSRLRDAANLDPAELAPQPLASLSRVARRFHLAFLALLLLLASIVFHAVGRLRSASRWPVAGAWTALVLGLLLAAVPVMASLASPTAVVVRQGAPILDAASPQAQVLSTLRRGEVVPILDDSGPYLRIQDSSGARGWVVADEVWPLDRVPEASALR